MPLQPLYRYRAQRSGAGENSIQYAAPRSMADEYCTCDHAYDTPPLPPVPKNKSFSSPSLAGSFLNGVIYLFLSWLGLVALIRSIVNQPTIGPIVLFVGFMLLEECLRFLPSRHYSAVIFGLFPSIAGELGA